ncbi:MAG: single-stranded-DNA-specific exonuclease RecJ [bacterium]
MPASSLEKNIIIPESIISSSQVKYLSETADIDKTVAALLVLRNIDTPQQIHDFFNPDISSLHDPFLLKDMELAVDRIGKAIMNREKITVYGDYDVDGITATSLLMLSLQKLGANVQQYIPNRFIDGYGISLDSIKTMSKEGVSLLISVDTGITANEEIDYAAGKGMDVIITDHHLPHSGYPNAYAIINPLQKECGYPYKYLCGAGLSFKLAQALYSRLEMDPADIYDLLSLVAIGSTADVVPLLGENRMLVQLGFLKLENTRRPGLLAMLELNNLIGRKITSFDIGFKIAPMINAVGRLGSPEKSFMLLTESDSSRAKLQALDLYKENEHRKELDRAITEECYNLVEAMDLSSTYFIVLQSENWHEGVIGIAASRVAEKYHRPTLIIATDDKNIGKGSARSVNSFHLVESIKKCEDLLVRFGGHKYAAGLTILKKNIPEFKVRINEITAESVKLEDLCPKIRPDMELDFASIDLKLAAQLQRFEPFGKKNEKPLFITRNIQLVQPPRILSGSHLKIRVKHGDNYFDGLLWNQADKLDAIVNGGRNLTLVYYIEINEWNKRQTVQLNIREVA